MSTVTAVPIAPVRRGYIVWLVVGILLAFVAAAALARAGDTGMTAMPSGLKYRVLTPGDGAARPSDTDIALVNYTGSLPDGTVFDRSQQPTPLPVSGVVPGFSEGLKLMTKGAKYRFWIPANLGYGDKATGPIPANSPLTFDVELVDFLPEATVRQLQQQQMQMQQMAPGGMPGAAAPAPGPGRR